MPFHTANVWIHRRKDKIMIQKLIQKIQKITIMVLQSITQVTLYMMVRNTSGLLQLQIKKEMHWLKVLITK